MIYVAIELQLWRWHWLFLSDFLLFAAKGCLVNLYISLLPQRSLSRNPVRLSWGMFKLLGSIVPQFSLLHSPFLSYWCLSVGGVEAELITSALLVKAISYCMTQDMSEIPVFFLIWLHPWMALECRASSVLVSSPDLLWDVFPVKGYSHGKCDRLAWMFSVKGWRDLSFCDHTLKKLSRHCRVCGWLWPETRKVQDINLKYSWRCLLAGEDF